MSQTSNIHGSRTALVTGSTSGIGLSIAHGLASQGCQIILNGLGDPKEIDALIQSFDDKYEKSPIFLDVDLTRHEELQEKLKNLPDIDILVNNAGFQHVSPVESFPFEVWRKMLDVMLTAPWLLTKHSLPQMRSKGWGRIINISSAHGQVASANKTGYVTCKHGIIGLTKVTALEAAGSGVTCNALCPGYVDTPILKSQVQALATKEGLQYYDAEEKFLSNFHVTRRPVPIEHLAEAVLFLCSDSGSQMTGSSLTMDGGWTAK